MVPLRFGRAPGTLMVITKGLADMVDCSQQLDTWTLATESVTTLPRLAWLAIIDRTNRTVQVRHGSSVEVGSNFIVEGVWDGVFTDAGFHRAQHFFGSGIRIDKDEVWLVPSRALVDRLIYCERNTELLASNSLALLLGFTNARLQSNHDYRRETYAILEGLAQYDPRFAVVHPSITEFMQAYHDPIVVTTSSLERHSVARHRTLASFEEYVGLLENVLGGMGANATHPRRRAPMVLFSTVSAGYDSAAVTALTRPLGLRASFTSRYAGAPFARWRRASRDDGSPVARHLGIPIRYLSKPRDIPEEELYFLAPSAAEPELIFHTMTRWIEEHCTAAVVFTGFHGDKVWDVATTMPYLTEEVKRGDSSGLNLSEIRLKAGFVNAAVPFLYARNIADLVTIARAPEMKAWRLNTDYDRPIPRRILETAGVPRAAFGRRKNAVVRAYNFPVSRSLRRAFFRHLQTRYRVGPLAVYWRTFADRINVIRWALVERIRRRLGRPKRKPPNPRPLRGIVMTYELHTWALEALADELRRGLSELVIRP